jgi:hypothetical protein
MAKYRNDVVFLLGLAAMAAGLYLIYPPLALLVVGVVLMALALASALRSGE